MHRYRSVLLALGLLAFVLALPVAAEEQEQDPAAAAPAPPPEDPPAEAEPTPAEEAPPPVPEIKDVDVTMEEVTKLKRRLQGSRIVRDQVVVGWKWEVEVALDRTPEAEAKAYVLEGELLDRLVEASTDVTDWRPGKPSKTRVRVVRRGYLPAEHADVISSVPLMASRELRKDLKIKPPPPPEPEPEPEPKPEPPQPAPARPEPEPRPREEERGNGPRAPGPEAMDPRLSRQESVKLVGRWEKEREEIGKKIAHFRAVMATAEGHEEQVTQAGKLVDEAAAAIEDSKGPYLACVALVDAGERVLLSLRQKVNTYHFKAQRNLQTTEKLLIVFTGPSSGGGN